MKIYAVYKGDEFLFMGTAKECAKHFGVRQQTIYDWSSSFFKKRILKNKSEHKRINHNRKMAIVIEED